VKRDLEKIINSLAEKIHQINLSEIAILVIESHIPMARICHTLCLMSEPFCAIFIKTGFLKNLSLLFSDPENLEILSQKIKELQDPQIIKQEVLS